MSSFAATLNNATKFAKLSAPLIPTTGSRLVVARLIAATNAFMSTDSIVGIDVSKTIDLLLLRKLVLAVKIHEDNIELYDVHYVCA